MGMFVLSDHSENVPKEFHKSHLHYDIFMSGAMLSLVLRSGLVALGYVVSHR